jgi:putative ABC transport system permease protein
MPAQTPLAWKNLTHDPRRLAVALSGVCFAVVLIFIELGFMNALLDSTVQILRNLNGELVIVSSMNYALPAREGFDARRIGQARGVRGVKAVYPLFLETTCLLRKEGARGYPIRVLAYDIDDEGVRLDLPEELRNALRNPESALTDTANRHKYQIPAAEADLASYRGELAGKHLELVGQFQMGIDFVNDGNLLMTEQNFAHYFPYRAGGRDPLSVVDLGVVQLEPGANPALVKQRLQQALGSTIDIFTKQEIIDREMRFWQTSVPVGFIFLVGVYMGFIVGVIICYQIIFSDIADHMREFATLKAMGYHHRYFMGLVLFQAVYLSLLGFVPGTVLSYVLYKLVSLATGLTLVLTPATIALVLVVTVAMCVVSGSLAVRKLLSLDPAELF